MFQVAAIEALIDIEACDASVFPTELLVDVFDHTGKARIRYSIARTLCARANFATERLLILFDDNDRQGIELICEALPRRLKRVPVEKLWDYFTLAHHECLQLSVLEKLEHLLPLFSLDELLALTSRTINTKTNRRILKFVTPHLETLSPAKLNDCLRNQSGEIADALVLAMAKHPDFSTAMLFERCKSMGWGHRVAVEKLSVRPDCTKEMLMTLFEGCTGYAQINVTRVLKKKRFALTVGDWLWLFSKSWTQTQPAVLKALCQHPNFSPNMLIAQLCETDTIEKKQAVINALRSYPDELKQVAGVTSQRQT